MLDRGRDARTPRAPRPRAATYGTSSRQSRARGDRRRRGRPVGIGRAPSMRRRRSSNRGEARRRRAAGRPSGTPSASIVGRVRSRSSAGARRIRAGSAPTRRGRGRPCRRVASGAQRRAAVGEQDPRRSGSIGERQRRCAGVAPTCANAVEQRRLVRRARPSALHHDRARHRSGCAGRRPRRDVRLFAAARPGRRSADGVRVAPIAQSAVAPARRRRPVRARRPAVRPCSALFPPPNSVPKMPRTMSWPSRDVTTLPPVRIAVSIVFWRALAAAAAAFSSARAAVRPRARPRFWAASISFCWRCDLALDAGPASSSSCRSRWSGRRRPAWPRPGVAAIAASRAAAIRAVIRSWALSRSTVVPYLACSGLVAIRPRN